MTRLLLRDIPKAALGYDGFELAVSGGFRGLRGVAPGFHRVELTADGRLVALHVVVAPADAVRAFVLRGGRFEPAPRSPLDAAAAAGDLDHALLDVAALPDAPARAWQALTSRLAIADDAAAWRAIDPPVDRAGWLALDGAAAGRLVVAVQGAWLAMTHDRDEAAADRLVALLGACAAVDPAIVRRHPAVFADVLDGVAAIRAVASELAATLLAGMAPLIAACAASGSPLAAAAAARLGPASRG